MLWCAFTCDVWTLGNILDDTVLEGLSIGVAKAGLGVGRLTEFRHYTSEVEQHSCEGLFFDSTPGAYRAIKYSEENFSNLDPL